MAYENFAFKSFPKYFFYKLEKKNNVMILKVFDVL